MKKGDKRIINGWVFYDWANSVYNLVISSAIFPIFYANITENYYLKEHGLKELPPDTSVTVDFFGHIISNTVLFSYVLSASFLLVSILSPLLSGIADATGSKKRFLQFFCYLGALASISLYWFNPAHIELGMTSIFLASLGFWNSLVFYNAFLPEIAEPKDHDVISAKGFSMGYFGSMILLIICLIIVQFIGPQYTKYCFVLVGVWWICFSQITFRRLPHNIYKRKVSRRVIWKGFKELKMVFNEFKKIKQLKRYLVSYFFYNTGVQTVMLMAVVFAKKEINWGPGGGDAGLIIAILLIQILAAAGAFIMAKLSHIFGNLNTLRVVVLSWMLLCIWAYFISTPVEFYLLASGVGIVMGGVQALSRSTYSKFLPDTQEHTSYFSFYDVTEKVGIVFGLFFFGLMEELTGDLRASVLSVVTFFVIGFIALLFVPKMKHNNIKT